MIYLGQVDSDDYSDADDLYRSLGYSNFDVNFSLCTGTEGVDRVCMSFLGGFHKSGLAYVLYNIRNEDGVAACEEIPDADQDGISDVIDLDYIDTPKKDIGGGSHDSEINECQNFVADPINLFNGNLVETQTDISFPSPFEQGLVFKRYYNSQSTDDSAIGFGWVHNYDFVLTPNFNNSSMLIEIVDGTGRGYYFEDYDSDGTFEGTFSENSTITTNTDGNYVWTRDDGSVYTFAASSGKFLSVVDKNGNELTLAYDDSDRLSTVTDQSSGRQLTFYYNEDNRIDYIKGPLTDGVSDGIWVTYTHDDNGNLIQVEYADDQNLSETANTTDPSPSGFIYEYDDPNADTNPDAVNNMTAKTDLAGYTISTWEYDDQDRAVENENREGKGATIDYSVSDQVSVTDAYGVTTVYQISEIRGLKKITGKSNSGGCSTCSEGIKETLFDEDTGYPTERTYFSGKVEEYMDYDDNFNPHTINIYEEDDSGNRTLIKTVDKTYHPVLSTPLTITEPSVISSGQEKETVFNYNDASGTQTNLIHSRIERGYTLDASGAVVSYEYTTLYTYNDQGQVETIDGPLTGTGDTMTMGYDQDTGDLLTITVPLSASLAGTITFGYDAAGNITSTTDLNGVVTTYTYDGRNRLLTSETSGKTSTQTYNPAGDPATFTDRTGKTTTWAYNTQGFVEKMVNSKEAYLYFNYDSNANRIEESIYTDQASLAQTRKYDFGDPATNTDLAPGQPWKSIVRDQEDTTDLDTVYTYEHGKVKTITTPDGLITEFFYDSFDQVYQATRTKSGTEQDTTVYSYDTHGNPVSITDAEGHTTTYLYDDLDRLVKTVSPDTGTTKYAYDDAGNMVQKKQNGTVAEYTHDDLGRVTQINYPSDTTQNVTLSYDEGIYGLGRLTSVVDPSGSYSFLYNDLGYLIEKNKTISNVLYRTAYEYDAEGRIKTITYPSGKFATFYLDDTGRPQKVTITSGEAIHTLADQITYYPFGPVTSLRFNNGKILTFSADLNYLTHEQTLTDLMDLEYGRDVSGDVEFINDYLDSTKDQTLGYDNLYRLISSTGPHGEASFSYDLVGNRQAKTADSITDTYSYIQTTNQIDEITGQATKSYSYNPNGTIQSIGTRQFEYNLNDRLIRVTDNGTVVAEYEYNYFGQRISKTVDSVTTIYHYDLSGHLIAETASDGTVLKEHVYLEGLPIAMIVPSSSSYCAADLDQDSDVDGTDLAGYSGSDLEALAMKFGGIYDSNLKIYYYHNDHLGTPVMLTDDGGNIAWQAEYSPFGAVTINAAVVENNLRYPGQYFDAETGLHYNWHRYYDPKIGRYLTPDPIGLAGGINPFLYAEANPVNYIDPFGLFDVALTPIATGLAPAISMLDSPILPFADTAAGALIGLAILHDTWPDDIPAKLAESSGNDSGSCQGKEPTPSTDPGDFDPWRDTKKNKKSGEVWIKDKLHKDHYEVYKSKKLYEKRVRHRAVWFDGRLKQKF